MNSFVSENWECSRVCKVLVVVLLWICGATNMLQAQDSERPNMVVIMLDDNAPDYLGAYGGPDITPNIDSLAQGGIKFTNAFSSASACTPSRYTLLTGNHAGHNNSSRFLEKNPVDRPYNLAWNTPLSDKTVTVAHLLGAAGYQTGFAGKWHLGVERSQLDLPQVNPAVSVESDSIDQKLQGYQQTLIQEVKQTSGFDNAESVIWENPNQIPYEQLRNHHMEWITKGAMDFLDRAKKSEEPFFLYLANTAVHGPSMSRVIDEDPKLTPEGRMSDHLQYQPSREEVKRRLVDTGVEVNHKNFGLAWADDQVGAITDKLKAMGEAENTLIVLLADHNTEPGKSTPYDKGNHIPMIFNWPEMWDGGQLRTELSQIPDIAPTLVDLAGLDAGEMDFDGQSLAPMKQNVNVKTHDDLYMEFGYSRAVRTDRYKYVAFKYPQFMIEGMKIGDIAKAPNFIDDHQQGQPNIAMRHFPDYFAQDQLYDLKNDSHEQQNLANDPAYADELQMMRDKLESHLQTFKHPYDLSHQSYRDTEAFKKKVEQTKAIGIDHIPWWDGMVWPKEQ